VANFYADNPDLRRRLDAVAWDTFLPALERNFEEDSEFAPDNLEEAREQIEMVLDTVGKITAEEIAPHAAEVDRVGVKLENGEVIYPEPIRRAFDLLAESGLTGLMLPREFGGMNFPTTAYTAVIEMISRADASLMTLFALQGCGDTIHRYGTQELKEKYLPPLCEGEATAAMALTEPDAGSALDTVGTRAFQTEDGSWVIRGSKCFITNGCADTLLVLARSEEKVKGAYGLSLFVVEKSERVQVAKLEDKLGIHGSATALLNFDDAPAILLGGRGAGLHPVALSLMNNARLEVASQAVGIAQAAQMQATRYAHERRQGRRTIDQFPAVRTMLFENAVQIEAARAIVIAAAEILDLHHGLKLTGGDEAEIDRLAGLADLLTPLAKYYAAEMSNEVTSRSLQVHGGYGYMRDYPVERHLRDARITSIYEGTSQVQVGTMIGPLMQGGLAELFKERLESATEPEGCAGALDLLRASYRRLDEALLGVRGAGKKAWQGWARLFADATADLFTALVFLEDAATHDRAAPLALYQARAAARSARRAEEAVRDRDVLSFDNESFGQVVEEYSPEN
jgi:alkylation response protein AidB-like acyl-CoA dehydrogenase